MEAGGGRELSYTRAKPLSEARSAERGEGQGGGGGCPPSPSRKKIEIRKCLDDF